MNTVFQTFCAFLYRDWRVFLPEYRERLVNGALWIGIVVLVFEYIMSHAGLVGFGEFNTIGCIASFGLFSGMNSIIPVVGDFETDRSITYYLTLPMPQWLIFVRIAISNTIAALTVAVLFLPMCKILLWNKLMLVHMNWPKYILIFLVSYIFYGFFSLFLASCTQSLRDIDNVWSRIIWPLWYIGCYQFRWSFLYKASPIVAYIDFLNPIMYIMEGTRAAALGQVDSLPYWWCIVAIVGFTIFFGWLGMYRLKKRLDCL